MGLDDDDVREILRIIDESQLDELRIETEGFSLYVRRGGALETAPPRPAPTGPAPDRAPAPATGASAASAGGNGDGDADGDDGLTITSPLLGTFYRAEGPGQAPFVEVGSHVEADTIVCILEVMKMMNSVPAGIAGTITEVCQANGELAEYGAPLFRISPAQ